MFTPQEVQEKVFPKASGFSGGYQMSSVDEFLDALTDDYTSLYKENVTLKAKLKVLADKVEEYRATEDSMRATLLTAQKMAAKLVQEAQSEHDSLVASAQKDAEETMAELSRQIEGEKAKLALAQKNTADFIRRSNELCKAQSDFLTSLPELDLVPAVEEQKKEEAVEDTVTNIGKGILEAFQAEDSAKEKKNPAGKVSGKVISKGSGKIIREKRPEKPAAVPVEIKTEDTTVIPSDFKLSLDELKFGRNYDKDEN